jgi:hypothetical protein
MQLTQTLFPIFREKYRSHVPGWTVLRPPIQIGEAANIYLDACHYYFPNYGG